MYYAKKQGTDIWRVFRGHLTQETPQHVGSSIAQRGLILPVFSYCTQKFLEVNMI